jgi:hypothetical protein
LTKNDRNFLSVGESSTYKRRNYCMLSAEHSARSIKRRNQSNNSQNATIRRFGQKITVISFPFVAVRRLNVLITACIAQNIAPAVLSVETSPTAREMRPFVDLDKNGRNFLPVGESSSYRRRNNCSLSAEHSARCIKRRKQQTTHNTRSFVDFDEK